MSCDVTRRRQNYVCFTMLKFLFPVMECRITNTESCIEHLQDNNPWFICNKFRCYRCVCVSALFTTTDSVPDLCTNIYTDIEETTPYFGNVKIWTINTQNSIKISSITVSHLEESSNVDQILSSSAVGDCF